MHGAAQIYNEADSRKLAFRWLSHRKFMARHQLSKNIGV